MAVGDDRVQLMKQESSALGGDDTDIGEYRQPLPISPQEDAIESAGLYLQDASNRDEEVYVEREGDDMRFRDKNNTSPVTLTALLSGSGGLTESAHRTLRQLIHFIDNGPAEGFTSGAYRETIHSGVFPTAIIWWESVSKLKKIVEKTLAYTGAFPTTITWKMYDTDGSTILATVTDSLTYSGSKETSRIRTIA